MSHKVNILNRIKLLWIQGLLLLYCLPIAGEKRTKVHKREVSVQTAWSKIWTRIADSISYDDDRYVKRKEYNNIYIYVKYPFPKNINTTAFRALEK